MVGVQFFDLALLTCALFLFFILWVVVTVAIAIRASFFLTIDDLIQSFW
jgi:hypothetical protein